MMNTIQTNILRFAPCVQKHWLIIYYLSSRRLGRKKLAVWIAWIFFAEIDGIDIIFSYTGTQIAKSYSSIQKPNSILIFEWNTAMIQQKRLSTEDIILHKSGCFQKQITG